MAHNHHRQFDYDNPRWLPYQQDKYSRWKIHPTTETGRERVNPPRSPYAYNAGHQPARRPSCWEPPPYQQYRNPYVSRQPESYPDIPYWSAPPQLREQEPPYWLNEFTAIEGEQHRRARQPWREPQLPSFADEPEPQRIHTVGYQGCFHDRGDRRQRQGFEEYPWRHQQPQSDRADQPPQLDRTLSHRKAPLHVVAPSRVGSKHLPHQCREFIGSGKQCGLPNDPALEVQSLSPVQQAAINDYNEKLRIYRLEQAALLARLNAWVEENIHDENEAEEKIDDNPMIVLGDDTPNDIANVPNDGASLDVPNNESLEEFVKNENESRQVLVEAYDDKVGDLIVSKLEIKDDVETLLKENVVCYEDIIILVESPANRNIGAITINSNISRSHNMFKCILESWCGSSIQSLIHYPQQPCTFDPGGKLMLSTIFIELLLPP